MLSNSTIAEIANQYGVYPRLVAAIIATESGGDVYAWRTEAQYGYLWDVSANKPFRKLTYAEKLSETAPIDFRSKRGSRNTEWLGQQASWGPMQVMGAVARELGFKEHFPSLCGEQGVHYGCRLLKKLFQRYNNTDSLLEDVVAAYNGGSANKLGNGEYINQEYVDKVLGLYNAHS